MPKRSSSDDAVSPAFAALQHVIDTTEAPSDDAARLKARIAELQRVCAETRIVAEAFKAPARVLDILDAAAHGLPIRGSMLPITDADFELRRSPETVSTAAALGRLGGLKGGKARADALSERRRKEIARKAAKARWRDRKG